MEIILHAAEDSNKTLNFSSSF